jgi:hypothetical protein
MPIHLPEQISGDSPQSQTKEVLRIRKLSKRLALACLLLMILLPLWVPYYFWSASDSALALNAHLMPQVLAQPIAPWQRAFAGLLTEIPVVLMAVGLWWARRCFSGFQQGQLFTVEAVLYLRKFAAWVMASALASMVIIAPISVALTMHNAPGNRHLAIGIGTDQVLALFFAALVWLMAGIIGQGQALADENKSFI